MIYTLTNIRKFQVGESIIHKVRIPGSNHKSSYKLLRDLTFQLSNGKLITIPKGFVWDLSSVPRFLWSLLPPEGDFEVGALIHDYLYVERKNPKFDWNTRKFADLEMLKWSEVLSGTEKRSWRNFDNRLRYFFVKWFGWLVWNDKIKIKTMSDITIRNSEKIAPISYEHAIYNYEQIDELCKILPFLKDKTGTVQYLGIPYGVPNNNTKMYINSKLIELNQQFPVCEKITFRVHGTADFDSRENYSFRFVGTDGTIQDFILVLVNAIPNQ